MKNKTDGKIDVDTQVGETVKCWFCNKEIPIEKAYVRGNITRYVCEEHKDSLEQMINR